LDSVRFGVNPNVTGLVLVSDGVVAGADIPGNMNPYAQFGDVHPTDVIDRSVYVYQGTFNLGPAAAIEHVSAAGNLMKHGRYAEALTEAELAKDLDPESPAAWKLIGDAFQAEGRSAEAYSAYDKAIHAKELDPVFGKDLVADLHKKLNQ
jgi:tetratricopeptide (TPR) repeat protein